MTREQARREIDSLDFYLQNHTDDYGEESHTAMMMAKDALSSSENPNKWIDAEVLDKIRAEIEEQKQARCFDEDDMLVYRTGLDDALYIIDKYKSESENKDDND